MSKRQRYARTGCATSDYFPRPGLRDIGIRRPADEGLDGLVFRQSQAVVSSRGGPVAIFGPLPEFAFVAPRKQGAILLRLVAENGLAFAQQLGWSEGLRHLGSLGFPFLPGAAIQPHLALGEPGTIGATTGRLQDGRQ